MISYQMEVWSVKIHFQRWHDGKEIYVLLLLNRLKVHALGLIVQWNILYLKKKKNIIECLFFIMFIPFFSVVHTFITISSETLILQI
jgi:hypothetical protein